jgi:lipopolysaccharide transport system ATP-binding protein
LTAVIRFERVSKMFTMHIERPRSFQELVINRFRRDNGSRQEFWAVEDASFTIEKGETVGLIGPNGAGKSTLLKLASRIVEPTAGRIEVNGRMGALLELGAGFHPDLTGRENVYLNGSILGLSRTEIRRRIDDIVAFAELERFIDVAVKHYSSGMYVRLGFAVAVSVEPDVLLVDEVLAVGDGAFQEKCLNRIRQMQAAGVSILLVSHSLDLVRQVCQRGLWLENAHIAADGNIDDVVGAYLAHLRRPLEIPVASVQHGQRWGSCEAEITSVIFAGAGSAPTNTLVCGEPFEVHIRYVAHQRISRPTFGLAVYTANGTHLIGPNSADTGYVIPAIEGEGEIVYRLEALPLQPGAYDLTAAIYDCNSIHAFDHHHRMYCFSVLPPTEHHRVEGFFHLPCTWEHHPA